MNSYLKPEVDLAPDFLPRDLGLDGNFELNQIKFVHARGYFQAVISEGWGFFLALTLGKFEKHISHRSLT